MTDFHSSHELVSKLKSVLLRQRLVLFFSGLLLTATAVILAAIGLSLLANVVVLPVWLKITLMAIVGLITIALFARYALGRLFHGSIDSVAISLEERNHDLKGRLIAAIQFARMARQPGFSADLIAATERQAIQKAGLINFNQVLSFHPVLRTGRYFLVAAVASVLMLTLLPGIFSYSYLVYSNPTTEIAPPIAYDVVPFPGATQWVKYKDIEIGASIFGARLPDRATVYHRFVDGSWQRDEIDLRKAPRVDLATGDSVRAVITLRQVNRSFDYYVEAGRVKTEVQQVDVVDRPRVNGIKLSVFYPDYTGLQPTVIDENDGSFSAVVGSRVNMQVETNLPIQQAELVFEDSSRTPLKVDSREATTSLKVDKSRGYYIRLLDNLGEENPDPIQYHITAVPDESPSIDVLRPGFNVNLGDEMILPLKVRIYDDYGFSSLVLKYTVVSQGHPSDENVAVLHFSDRIKTEGEIEFNWDMDKLNMFPGDYTTYYFEVADNDRISGPKVTRSRQYVARIPSLDEIIAEAEGEGAKRINNTEQLLREGKDLSERFKAMARKLKAQMHNPQEADWQDKKELQALADKNEELIQNVQKLADNMDKSVDKMAQNAQMSREIVEKMQQIQKLFEEVATPEMREAQKKLMEALKNMDQQQMEQAMKDFQMSQDELLKRLERTLALLKRMQLQQKMEAMVRKAEQLLEKQNQMNNKTDSSGADKLPEMAKDEQALKDELEALKKEVPEMRDLMKQAQMEKSEEAEQFAQALEKTDANQDMQQMSQSMSDQEKKEASKKGKSAASKLAEMLNDMQQMLASMNSDQNEEVKKMMRLAIDDSNYLSKAQEELLKEASAMSPRSDAAREFAQTQQDLAQSCSGLKKRIAELAKESPFIASELGKLVNDATAQMELAQTGFSDKRTAEALRSQRDAMYNLNQASLRLMDAMNSQKSCDKGGNCNKNVSKMESLSNKQMQLNQKTQGQCNKPSSNPSSKMQAGREGLKRLAGEQGAIRKSMEELAKEFGDSRQVLGRLQDIADEMKKVEEDLASGEVGPETTERQLRIYSRMLQASRSLQRRDYTEQRQATSAKEQAFSVPPPLPAELLNDRTNLEDRLRRYLGDNYPRQYEEQIKAYFRALLQSESTPTEDGQ